MCSGSYFPPPVRGVPIPKKSGGTRMLGVPTVADRVAQTVVKMVLEPVLEPCFHRDSFGYRPGRSALDAVALVRRRSWEYDWVVEFDIKGLFDNIDHELMLRAVRKHCQTPWVLLYIERWLKAPMETEEGTLVARTRGTPQGGVVSPLLANLFLHYVLDVWVTPHHAERALLPLRRRWGHSLQERGAGAVGAAQGRAQAARVRARTAPGEDADCLLPGRQSAGARIR